MLLTPGARNAEALKDFELHPLGDPEYIPSNRAEAINPAAVAAGRSVSMPAYLISYDLNNPPEDPNYSPLIKRLNALGAKRVLYSEWVLQTNASSVDLRNDLQKYIDSNDLLLVLKVTGEAAWTKLMISNDEFKSVLNA